MSCKCDRKFEIAKVLTSDEIAENGVAGQESSCRGQSAAHRALHRRLAEPAAQVPRRQREGGRAAADTALLRS